MKTPARYMMSKRAVLLAGQDSQTAPFGASSCMAMMEKMTGQQGQGDCAEMMSQMMPQMMATFGGAQGETEEATTAETTQKA